MIDTIVKMMIQHQAPVLDIKTIETNTAAHVAERYCFTSENISLGQACNSRLHRMSLNEAINFWLEFQIELQRVGWHQLPKYLSEGTDE